MAEAPAPQRPKTAIPRNPGRHDLGMKATLPVPGQGHRRQVLRAARSTRPAGPATRSSTRRRSSAGPRRARSRRRRCRKLIGRHRVGPRLDDRAHRVHVRDRGVSRTLSHQLVRHRAGVAFDQQSQRYVKYKGASTMLPGDHRRGRARPARALRGAGRGVDGLYGELVAAGIPGEDARFVFPNATRTNLVMTTNLRALIHMSGLRLCTMAQWEIRRLFQLIRHEIFGVSARSWAAFLAPEVRGPRLLRRDRQPRRALPDPAAQGQRPRPPGRRSATKPRRPAGSCRSPDPIGAGVRRHQFERGSPSA